MMATTTDTTYNGWANYQTWNIKLWLDNDQASQAYWLEQTHAEWAYACHERDTSTSVLTDSQFARTSLADNLEQEITEQAPDLGASMFSDLLGHALGAVDWLEIADAMLTDAELDGYEPRT